jgi:hypothetical protein
VIEWQVIALAHAPEVYRSRALARSKALMKWSAVRAGDITFSVLGMAKATLHKEIASLCADYDHVVIDGPVVRNYSIVPIDDRGATHGNINP